jgi:hypothetical protein
MYNQDRANLSPRAGFASIDKNAELDDSTQSSMARFGSASTALGAITTRLANFGGDAKAAKRRRQRSASDAMLFEVKQNILMKNPFLFRAFKERVAASNVHAPILILGVLMEFFKDLKIPDIQHELKQEAIARSSLPIDNDLRDHFTTSKPASKRLRKNGVPATKSTTTTATITNATSKLSLEESTRFSSTGRQNTSSPLRTVARTIIEDDTDETSDSSDDENSVSDSSTDDENSVSDSSSDGETIISASSYASGSSYGSFMSDSGESQESERLEV